MIGQPVTDPLPDDLRVWQLPNGRYVYLRADGRYEVQPPTDNWWHTETTLEAAVAWFAAQLTREG